MLLDELIYKRFLDCEAITKKLTKYGEQPAIFYSEVPDDQQIEWNELQYPRICYYYDMQANAERKSSGSLIVSLMCQNTGEQLPEQIEPLIRECLKDVLLTPEGGSPYCFTWSGTDAFSYQNQSGSNTVTSDLIIGSEIRFDILEYPIQETTDLDPIVATNRYLKELYPEVIVLGLDHIPEILKADKIPVFYCRLLSAEMVEETNTIAWMNGRIAVHLLCPEQQKRDKMMMAVTNQLGLDGEILMLDYSPMFIRALVANYKADYLTEGQLSFTGKYGLLRRPVKKPKIATIQLKGVN